MRPLLQYASLILKWQFNPQITSQRILRPLGRQKNADFYTVIHDGGVPKGEYAKQGNSLFDLWKSVQSVDNCFLQVEM